MRVLFCIRLLLLIVFRTHFQGDDYCLMCIKDGDTAAAISTFNIGEINAEFDDVSDLSMAIVTYAKDYCTFQSTNLLLIICHTLCRNL